jgi:hypothetical protein
MANRKTTRKQRFLVIIVLVLITGFSSCRTGRDIPSRRMKPMSAEKLLNQARQNAFEFDNLTIRRINVQFSDGEMRTSFRANLKAAKDEKILASVSKLNIPVGRILLTPDSVTYVNYIDKNYYEGDYSYISSMLDFSLSFNLVQTVLTNPIKHGAGGTEIDHYNFETSVEDGRYVLHSTGHLSGGASEQKRFYVRNHSAQNSFVNEELAVRKMMFNPNSFVLEKLVMDNPMEDLKLEVDFSAFEKVDGYDYPGSIDVKMMSGNDLTELNIKLKGFSTGRVDSLELNIPQSYRRIRSR